MGRLSRGLTTSRVFWLVLAAITLALHVAWARNTHGANLERCGALWAVYGAALLARPVIRQGYAAWFRASQTLDAGFDPKPPEQIEAERQAAIDATCVQVIGPALIVAGTLLWGYGDLLGHWLFACRCR